MTKIEWANETWNPITGCSKISAGCKNCYAERMAKRLKGRFGYPEDKPFSVAFHQDKLRQPLSWKKPRAIFVCSMGDLFHKDVKNHQIDDVFEIIRQAQQHTFMVLTKRPERMYEWADSTNARSDDLLANCPNLFLGVTAENQRTADERIPTLLKIPAAVRFVSVEPMLEFMLLEKYMGYYEKYNFGSPAPKLDWVICGAETGPGARPMKAEWATSLKNQCDNSNNIPFFFKKDSEGNRELGGTIYEEYPDMGDYSS